MMKADTTRMTMANPSRKFWKKPITSLNASVCSSTNCSLATTSVPAGITALMAAATSSLEASGVKRMSMLS